MWDGSGSIGAVATAPGDPGLTRQRLLRRGVGLEWVTLAWNVVGIVVLAVAATRSRSVALAGFGLDSLVEIGASAVVLWELASTHEHRRRSALRLIGVAFLALSGYVAVQSAAVLATATEPGTACSVSPGQLSPPPSCPRWPPARRAPGAPWTTRS